MKQTLLNTGASRGMGRATADLFQAKVWQLVALLFLLQASLALAADPAKEVKAAADALNAAFEAHDAKTIRALMTPDHLAVTPYAGKQRVKDQIRTLPVLKYEKYSAGPMSMKVIDDNCVLVTYALELKGTYQGKPLPSQSLVASLWVKNGGKWQELLYQETPVDGR
jgi:uncharacterized protein (TIGR02246 family)